MQIPDSGTQREHLLQACKQTGKTPEELGIVLPEAEVVDVPEGGEFLWESFWELSYSRGNNGFAENPLSWLEIQAWAGLNGLELTPFQAAALRSMDHTYLATRADLAAKNAKKKSL